MAADMLLVYGPEEFLRRRAEKEALEKFGLSRSDVLVVDSETSREADVPSLLDELRTPSLFSPRRGVVVRESSPLLSEKAFHSFIEKELPRLDNVLLVVNCPKPPAPLLKAARKVGKAVEFKRLYATDYNTGAVSARSKFGQWLRREASQLGLKLTDDTVVTVIEASGRDPAQALELLQALSLTSGKAALTPEEVHAISGARPADSASELERAALSGDFGAAARIIEEGFRHGIYRFGKYTNSAGSITAAFLDALVLAALHIYRIRCGNLSPAKAGVFRQKESLYLDRVSRTSREEAADLLECAFRAEWLFKAGLADGRDALLWFAARLCGVRAPDPGSFGEALTRK